MDKNILNCFITLFFQKKISCLKKKVRVGSIFLAQVFQNFCVTIVYHRQPSWGMQIDIIVVVDQIPEFRAKNTNC